MQAIWKELLLLCLCMVLAILLPRLFIKTNVKVDNQGVSMDLTEINPMQTIQPNKLIESPLFTETRKLNFESDVMTSDDVNETLTEPVPPEPKLVGVVSGFGKSVIIVKGNSGEDQNLEIGDNIDGWRLINVGNNSATFQAADVRRVIRLDYFNKVGSAIIKNEKLSYTDIEDNKNE